MGSALGSLHFLLKMWGNTSIINVLLPLLYKYFLFNFLNKLSKRWWIFNRNPLLPCLEECQNDWILGLKATISVWKRICQNEIAFALAGLSTTAQRVESKIFIFTFCLSFPLHLLEDFYISSYLVLVVGTTSSIELFFSRTRQLGSTILFYKELGIVQFSIKHWK